jgi:hypothetical protein
MKPIITQSIRGELEAYVDTHGLDEVLHALVEIAHEKADHVTMTWGDKHLTKAWTRAGSVIERCAEAIEKLEIP